MLCKVIHILTIINYTDIASDENINNITIKQIDIFLSNPYTLSCKNLSIPNEDL